MTPKLGITLPVFTDDTDSVLNAARRAESKGLDSIWVFDHLWPLTGGKERPILESWSALAWLAAATETITVGTLVTRSTLRNPGVLARMADTVEAIAPGRLVITIGSGDSASRGENEAFGVPYLEPPARYEQLSDTVTGVRRTLEGETEVPLVGTGARPRIWVAGHADEVLAIAAEEADGWNGWGGSPQSFADDAAKVLASNPDTEITWAGLVVLGADDAAASQRLGDKKVGDRIVGGPATVAARLRAFAGAGASHVICTEFGAWTPERIDVLAAAIRPALV